MKFLKIFIIVSLCSVSLMFPQITFTDVTKQAGIDFRHNNAADGRKFLPETMGSGAAFFDYNNDGWLDIFLANGMSWPDKKTKKSLSALYRNNKNGTFTDVTTAAGITAEFFAMGVAAADYDNDGDQDLYISGLGPDHFYVNLGNGKFQEATKSAGLDNPEFGTSCAFLDYDKDGYLDLFVANYVQWTAESDIFCSLDGESKSYCTPQAYQGASPKLYRNLGNGKFQDATQAAGILDPTNKGLGALIFDYNNDGWPDIMMANDTQPNKLWENQGNGTFTEVGILAGIALSEDGMARGAMGIDAGDYDRSGFLSVIIGNFSNEMLSLYHNEKNSFFIDDAPTSTVGPSSLLTLAFGTFFFDFDLDGYLDIFAANGHVENEINQVQKEVTFAQSSHLFRNVNGRDFKEVTFQMGKDFASPKVARGAAYGDYDNDGDLDILLTTCGGPAYLYRNDGGNQNSWVTLKLKGDQSNRDGIGALVNLRANNVTQTGILKSGGSYCSQSQLRLTFGLGEVKRVDSVIIKWPSGKEQQISEIPINQIVTVDEKTGLLISSKQSNVTAE